MALEQAKIAEQQLTVQAGGNAELQQQVEILKETIKLYEEQISLYKNMVDIHSKISDAKDKACTEQIKAATPTFMENLGKYTVGGGVGAVLLGLALILI